MPTININSIEPNSKVYLTGIVDFSRIASQLDGDELAADNARKLANGMKPTSKAHTRLSISHCAIDYANPAQPTLAEQFISEKLWRSTLHPEKEFCYAAINKSRNLPNLYCRENSTSKQLEAVTATAELAIGTPVTIVLRFFTTNLNNGVSLDSVIVNEKPIRWSAGAAGNALADRGFEIVNASVDAVRNQLKEETPAAPAAPAAPEYVQPASTSYTQPAAAPASTAYVQPAAAPAAAPSLPVPPKGYVYDANNRLVPESTLNGQSGQTAGGIKL